MRFHTGTSRGHFSFALYGQGSDITSIPYFGTDSLATGREGCGPVCDWPGEVASVVAAGGELDPIDGR
jgi:hypothetical protein